MTDLVMSIEDDSPRSRRVRSVSDSGSSLTGRGQAPVRIGGEPPEPAEARTTGRRAIVADPADTLDDLPANVVESIRYLVVSLQHQQKEAQLPLRLGLTSALAGEGVSFTSRALGAVVAHDLRERVCVIDLNWTDQLSGKARRRHRKKSETEVVQLGLADALRRDATLREVISVTSDPRLTLVPAGTATPAEAQVFSQSSELAHIINVLQRHHDRLILDLPPVLSSSTAISLARHADVIAFVVRYGVTSVTQVKLALERLGPVPSLGIVLNRAETRIPRSLQRRLSSW
jgi:Mrp family chromosome partitioning ATPase